VHKDILTLFVWLAYFLLSGLNGYMKKTAQGERVVVLDNIRSTFNVGSIFRTADCLGISKIFLCGITPAPQDRFGRARADIAKVSLGAEKTIAWEQSSLTAELVKKLKKEGFKIVSIEQDARAVDYRELKIKKSENIALVMGNEVSGVSPDVLKISDTIAEIPLHGEKESLNVLVAFAVAGFRIWE
jgi:23S rRNA (guanosine2251-2'-O)-methyltransferase